jgi:hypothetical protein
MTGHDLNLWGLLLPAAHELVAFLLELLPPLSKEGELLAAPDLFILGYHINALFIRIIT